MIEIILSVLMYILLVVFIALISAAVPFLVYRRWKNKKTFVILFCICLVIILGWLVHRVDHPFLICAKYEESITCEEKQRIIGLNSGVYSDSIPFIPVCIIVKNADEEEILVNTWYIPFGYTEMSITDDGPNLIRGLFGQ
ncbi:MAG: hypothetical protein IJK86_08600 [Lachnospiraceae bacterium]|nr:hypothetical protein [Lachnospiraceae bacterium]